LLDKVLEEIGIDRKKTYVTNAVKHFKWEPRGKRRIHKKPNAAEIAACGPWLEAEIATLHPKVIVCLGATAAQSLSDVTSASQNIAANSSSPLSHRTLWPPFIHPPYCALPTKKPATRNSSNSPMTFEKSRHSLERCYIRPTWLVNAREKSARPSP
jgi:uracil-DNA glycosylase family 4